MSYRRQPPPATKVTTSLLLSLVRNLAANRLPFQTHNAVYLLSQLKQFDKQTYDTFLRSVKPVYFVPASLTEGLHLPTEVRPKYELPLAKHYLNCKESAADFEARKFFHLDESSWDAMKNSDSHAETAFRGEYLPRCGETGLFFTREEVVDNLQAAGFDMGFTSPFWIRTTHPKLQDGFLQLKPGSESIGIGLNSSIISVMDVQPFPLTLLHPSLQAAAISSRSDKQANGSWFTPSASIPVGMNAISGFVSPNPWIHQLGHRGLWLSHEQLLLHGLKPKKVVKNPLEACMLVEVERWQLHNADQLMVPGRLALQTNPSSPTTDVLFR